VRSSIGCRNNTVFSIPDLIHNWLESPLWTFKNELNALSDHRLASRRLNTETVGWWTANNIEWLVVMWQSP
jgi:hypothetical protein